MLGVLKRRLKPKRATNEKENQNNRKYVHSKGETIVPVDVTRIVPSQRQIHPLFEEKVQVLGYDDVGRGSVGSGESKTSPKTSAPAPSLKRSPDVAFPPPPPPPPLPSLLQRRQKSPKHVARRPSATLFRSSASAKPPHQTFHPAPNICVEGGRIEFIKSPSEGSNLASLNPPARGCFDKRAREGQTLSGKSEEQLAASKESTRRTRAQETQADPKDFEGSREEKCDLAKEYLETRIKELQKLLESEQKSLQREKLTITRLQRQLARRDAIQRDVDRERRLRTDTESRLRDTVSESERYRATLAGLQREFSKMEDSVRTMLQYKSRCELLNQEKVFLTAAYESRIHQYQNTVTKLGQENETLKQQVRLLEEATGTEELPDALLDRLRVLEKENAHLSRDADFQRKQYERCLDDIANQVVRALLSQKGLREEIGNLQRRIKELENQNQALASILVNKGTAAFGLPPGDSEVDQVVANGALWFPGTFPAIDASLSTDTAATTTKESSLASSPSSGFAARNDERKCLRRRYFSDLADLRERNLFRSLNSVDSLVVVPLQRPKSLNLQLQTSPKALSGVSSMVTGRRSQHRKYNSVTPSKKPAEDEGNESPESGNRDEGYSTMSSDIQGPGEASELSKRELEDLKEASDETDVILDGGSDLKSIVIVEDASDPDIFFIPLNVSLSINPRHSYPPNKDLLPFRGGVRSLSDSHLCLKVTATSSAISSPLSPSVFFVDIVDRKHPLRRTKATSSLLATKEQEKDSEDEDSWGSGVVEGCWWDAEYVQHWLKLDDHRLKGQQQREMLELEYDRTEIEEWTMSLSCEDVTKSGETANTATLPSTDQNNFQSNKEDDEREWNDFNCVNLTIDTKTEDDPRWPYDANETEEKYAWQETSPGGSWSSGSAHGSDKSCRSLNESYFNDCRADTVESKRSSDAGDVAEVSSTVGTDFTRDFYRLVKFESTKSLASNSSRSNGKCDFTSLHPKSSEYAQEREMALQSVLSFIVEQQKYCHNREEQDGDLEPQSAVPESDNLHSEKDRILDVAGEKETHVLIQNDVNDYLAEKVETTAAPQAASVRKKVEITINLTSAGQDSGSSSSTGSGGRKTLTESAQRAQRVFEREASTKLPVRNNRMRTSTPIPISRSDKVLKMDNYQKNSEVNKVRPQSEYFNNTQKRKSWKVNSPSQEERVTSQLSNDTTEYVGDYESRKSSKSPSPSKAAAIKSRETRIPVSVGEVTSPINSTGAYSKLPRPKTNPRVRGTKIPVISTRKSESALVSKTKVLDSSSLRAANPRKTTSATERRFNETRKPPVPEAPANRQLFADETSFHQKATTKDVIEELNRMIRKGEDVSPNSNGDGEFRPLDVACCCPTGWVHVERDIDFADPKARANLLDVMLASSGSSESSETSSESGGDEPVDYSHLHRLHRFRRQRKASATREQLAVLRYSLSSAARPSIIGRENFFVRYGEKEKEAVASFDFLEDISTTSVSDCSSCDSLGSNHSSCLKSALTSPTDQELPLSELDIGTPLTPTTPGTPSDDSDERTGGPVSLSDSCADSYSESGGSVPEEPCPNAAIEKD